MFISYLSYPLIILLCYPPLPTSHCLYPHSHPISPSPSLFPSVSLKALLFLKYIILNFAYLVLLTSTKAISIIACSLLLRNSRKQTYATATTKDPFGFDNDPFFSDENESSKQTGYGNAQEYDGRSSAYGRFIHIPIS